MAQQRFQHRAMVLARQRFDDETDAVSLRLGASALVRGHDGDPSRIETTDMAQDERQDALADAEASGREVHV